MTVVIDCNVIVMCLTSKSPYHSIYQAVVSRAFKLAISLEILLEYEEIVQRKYGMVTANAFIALLKELPNVESAHSFFKWNLIDADPDDNKYVDCAIAGEADYLVTEDKHFSVLQNISFPAIKILGIDDFLNLLRQ